MIVLSYIVILASIVLTMTQSSVLEGDANGFRLYNSCVAAVVLNSLPSAVHLAHCSDAHSLHSSSHSHAATAVVLPLHTVTGLLT